MLAELCSMTICHLHHFIFYTLWFVFHIHYGCATNALSFIHLFIHLFIHCISKSECNILTWWSSLQQRQRRRLAATVWRNDACVVRCIMSTTAQLSWVDDQSTAAASQTTWDFQLLLLLLLAWRRLDSSQYSESHIDARPYIYVRSLRPSHHSSARHAGHGTIQHSYASPRKVGTWDGFTKFTTSSGPFRRLFVLFCEMKSYFINAPLQGLWAPLKNGRLTPWSS